VATPGHAKGQDPVLERVLGLDELLDDETCLAGLAQPVEPLALVRLRTGLRGSQLLQLRAREQVGVALDDCGLFRDLLLADTNSARLLGPLEEVASEALLERSRRQHRDTHAGDA